MTKPFCNAESITSSQIRRVAFNDIFYNNVGITRSSYNVFMARLFNLSYANFLKMARDIYGATLHGKYGGYITMTFKNTKDCDKLVKELNRRWDILVKEFKTNE
jgi:hypothetical protein